MKNKLTRLPENFNRTDYINFLNSRCDDRIIDTFILDNGAFDIIAQGDGALAVKVHNYDGDTFWLSEHWETESGAARGILVFLANQTA